MAIVNVNGISGINSITAQSGSLNFYTAAGNNLPISAATLNVGTGASVSSPATNVLVLGTNNAERVRVGAAGSVGIGTDNPLGVLAVSGGVSNPTITFQNGSASNTAPDALVGGIVGYSRTTGGNINIGSVDIRTDTASASSGAVRILTALNGSLAETFRITSTGQLQATGAADVRLTLGSGGTAGTNDSVHIRADGANLKFMNASGGVTIFEQNGTERVRIDSSGRVTTPYQVAFHAIKTVGDTLTTTAAKLSFGSATYDVGSNYSDANDRFTAPVAGKYFFYVSVNVLNSSNASLIYIRKNGSTYGQIFYAATNYPRMDFNPVGIIDLAVSDYVEIFGSISSGTVSVDNAGYFGGYLLG